MFESLRSRKKDLAQWPTRLQQLNPPGDERTQILARTGKMRALAPLQPDPEPRRPSTRRGLLSWMVLRRTSLAADGAPAEEEGPPKERLEIDGQELRAWLQRELRALLLEDMATPLETAPRSLLSTEDTANHGATITLGRQQGAVIYLYLARVKILSLPLQDIICPQLHVYVEDCELRWVSTENSHLHTLTLQNVTCKAWPGVYLQAVSAKFEDEVILIGNELDANFRNGAPRGGTYPEEVRNCYAAVQAHDITARVVTLWNIALTGANYLQFLKDQRPGEFPGHYWSMSRGIGLFRAQLEYFRAYNCHFHGPLSLRFATVTSQTKFDECYFRGYFFEPPYPDPEPRVLDEFDGDDERPLTWQILDVSRADLGREFVFRNMDPHARKLGHDRIAELRSTGWMNWSHAKTVALDDDATLWLDPNPWWMTLWEVFRVWALLPLNVAQRRRVRFRLNGFHYETVVQPHLDRTTKDMSATITPAWAPPREMRTFAEWGSSILRGIREWLFGPPTDNGSTSETRSDARPAEKYDMLKALRSAPRIGDQADQQISWLLCQLKPDLEKRFMTQPWTEAGHAFLKTGNRGLANRLFYVREKMWHRSLRLVDPAEKHASPPRRFFLFCGRWLQWAFYGIFSWLPGYGYRIWLPFAVGFALWYIGAHVFAWAHHDGFLMQSPDAAHQIEVQQQKTARSIANGLEQALLLLPPRPALADGRRLCGGEPSIERSVPCPGDGAESAVAPALPLSKPGGDAAATTSARPSEAVPMQQPSSPTASQEETQPLKVDKYAAFNANMYSLDLLLPVIEFSQSSYWIPGENEQKMREHKWSQETRDRALYWYWIAYWAQIFFGWYLSTVIVSSLTGLLERKE
jgi:hypothetical protein